MCRHGASDIGTEDHGYRLRKLHDTGVYKTDQHNGRGGRALNDARDTESERPALDVSRGLGLTRCQFFEDFVQASAGQLFQRGTHKAHSEEEEADAAE